MRLIIVRCFIIVVVFSVAESKALATENDVFQYLRKYGYIDDEATETQLNQYAMNNHEADAIKSFQRMFHIPETGVIDDATKEAVLQPRCGVKDKLVVDSQRYVANQFDYWRHNDITYTVTTFTNDMSRSDQEAVFARAFKMWSDVTPLTFTYLPDRRGSEVDIELFFAFYSHGDPSPFDGRDGVLAHAFFPGAGGDVHFDDSETFTLDISGGTRELFQVAAHEIGHSLGLGHSYVSQALMAPSYRYTPNFQLHQDDIDGIQFLYGPRVAPPAPPPEEPQEEPGDPSTVDFCQDDQFDAITETDGGVLYGFRGPYAFNLAAQEVSPVLIDSVFPEAPYHLDAAVHWPSSSPNTTPGKTFLFKGSYVWVYHGYEYQYNRYIPDQFPGLPVNIDSAFVAGGRGFMGDITYFIQGVHYYETNSNSNGRITGSVYEGVTKRWLRRTDEYIERIDSAVYWADYAYFFTGNRYYKFDDELYTIIDGPKSIKNDWYRCGGQGSPQPESPTNEPDPPQPESPTNEPNPPQSEYPTNEPDPPQSEYPTNEPQNPPRVDFCQDDQFDAITRTDDGLYGFRGTYIYNLGAANISAQPIEDVFPNAPPRVDAVLYWPGVGVDWSTCVNGQCLPEKGRTFLFRGSDVWVYIGYEFQYSAYIFMEFPGLPSYIDSAFVWTGSESSKTYFTKGHNYYRTTNGDGKIDSGYPKSLDVWMVNTDSAISSGIDRIDSATQWNNNTYFFTGNRYYRFNDKDFKIDEDYPKSIRKDWYRCQ